VRVKAPLRSLPLIALLWAVFAQAPAQAAPLDEALSAARAAITAGDSKAAAEALARAELAASAATAPVRPAELAAIWLYQGVLLRAAHDPKGRYNDLWRQALVVDNTLPWDEALLKDDDAFSLFEALRTEVRGRPKLSTGAPAAVGAAKLYIDGARTNAEDTRHEGVHLAQITCPDGCTYSGWTTLRPPPQPLAWCPGGVDLSAAPAEEEDEFDGMGPVFGVQSAAEGPAGCAVSATAPKPSPAPPVVKGVGGSAKAGGPKAADPKDSGPKDRAPKDGGPGGGKLPVLLMSSGGLLVIGAVGVNFGLTAPRYQAVADAQQDPTGLSRADADALSAAFNLARGLTLGLGAAGLGLGGAGIGLQLGERSTATGFISPTGAGISGRF